MTPAPAADGVAELALSTARAATYVAASLSDNTRRAYQGQWQRYETWCAARNVEALPSAPETVALYLVGLADRGLKAASIELALAAITKAHTVAGYPSPRDNRVPAAVRQGIRRTIGTAQTGKAALLGEGLREALSLSGARGLAGLRDRAVLLLGWLGAFRRSELVALNVEDVAWVDHGLEVRLRRSKTDQEGAGRVLPFPRAQLAELCPVRVLRAWLDAAKITEGALLRSVDQWGHVGGRLSAHGVARVVKRAAALAGLNPEEFSGHSLRSGLVTDAHLHGRSDAEIMRITGHASVAMLRRYIKLAELWQGVATEGLLDQVGAEEAAA